MSTEVSSGRTPLRLDPLAALTDDLICIVDSDHRIVDVNPAWQRRLGWRPDQLIGRDSSELVHPEDRQRTDAASAQVGADGIHAIAFENRSRCADGSYRWVSWTALAEAGGSMYAVGRDLAERTTGRLGLTREFYRQVVESSEDAIITKDRDAIITSWNDAAERMYGYSREEALGRPLSILVPPDRRGEELEILGSVLAGNSIQHYETERITKDGRRLTVWLSVSAVRAADDEIVGAAAIARDITDRKEMERRLAYLAQHDPLTGLLNRSRFEEELEQQLRHAARYRRPGAILAIDLDDFKVINDTWGHVAGDALLKRVARMLKEHLRDADLVARMGGDEFAVLLPEIEADHAVDVAGKLLKSLGSRWEGRPIAASIGVATFYPSARLTVGDLMIAADAALYDAKDAGRNRVARYSGQRSASLGWVARIRRALDEDRLRLESQPILDLRSGELSHEELLIRMVGEKGETLPPASFLPTAERFGMIQELDRWVIDRAIELAGEGRRVAVNLSGHSIGDPGVISHIEQCLDQTQADPGNLVFELTETAAVVNMVEAHRSTERLAELGCSLALDDFGTGFGPFSYLKQLPLKYLKIDPEFVRNLASDSSDRHLIQAIVSLAHGFEKLTIAEGVETEATLQAVLGYGVDCAQGFHLGRPQPLAARA